MTTALLAFDTATEVLAVALGAPARDFTACEAGGSRASARLLPLVRELMAQAGLQFADLGAIAFGRGPGAFTGLRTSCAVAQGLALGAGKRVLAIDSLLVVADDARQQCGIDSPVDVHVAMDARMQEIYSASYHWDGRRWQALRPPALSAVADWAAHAATLQGGLLAGSAVPLHALQGAVAGTTAVPEERDRAAALLRLARMAHADGLGLSPAQALPLYVRDKVALTTSEREAARRAREGLPA